MVIKRASSGKRHYILPVCNIPLTVYMTFQARAYLRGGGFKPPPKFSDFFLKSEGKEIERKRKKGMLEGGGGVLLNIFFGLIFFRVGLRYFQGG